MDLKEEILKEHSRRQAEKIAGWIGNDKQKFSRLINLITQGEYAIAQRAAYPLSLVAEKNPKLAESQLHLLIDKCLNDKNVHDAVKRNVVRIMQFINIPEKLQAKAMNLCMDYLADPNETIAVRCFSMTVLANLAKLYPDIKHEVEEVINVSMKNSTPGLKARAKKVMKSL